MKEQLRTGCIDPDQTNRRVLAPDRAICPTHKLAGQETTTLIFCGFYLIGEGARGLARRLLCWGQVAERSIVGSSLPTIVKRNIMSKIIAAMLLAGCTLTFASAPLTFDMASAPIAAPSAFATPGAAHVLPPNKPHLDGDRPR